MKKEKSYDEESNYLCKDFIRPDTDDATFWSKSVGDGYLHHSAADEILKVGVEEGLIKIKSIKIPCPGYPGINLSGYRVLYLLEKTVP